MSKHLRPPPQFSSPGLGIATIIVVIALLLLVFALPA